MTRFARGFKKKYIEASSWEELRSSATASKDKIGLSSNKNNASQQDHRKTLSKQEIKQEKKREARRKRRSMKKICFHCRKHGHPLSQCPSLKTKESPVDICFKCGSTEHKVQQCKVKVKKDEYPFAKCFVCGKEGHISKLCAENPRGLYPLGGGCKLCGSVEHFKRDCPEGNKTASTKPNAVSKRGSFDKTSADAEAFSDIDDDVINLNPTNKKKSKVVKF